jgi:hypothetical protein
MRVECLYFIMTHLIYKETRYLWDIIQFESGNNSKYYVLSVTGTWDEMR